MVLLWDYDEKELKKSARGRLLLLERQINYGYYPSDSEKDKINLNTVKKNWDKLKLEPKRRRLFEHLIWSR